MSTAGTRLARCVAILTPYARYYGGVEYVNQLMVSMLEREGVRARVVSQEMLRRGPLFKLRKRIFGLSGMLAWHFSRHYAAETDVVICNGEFSLGVRHPAAINLFHGCYLGYANAMRPYLSRRAYRGLMRLADQQRRGAEGKHVVAVSRAVARILESQAIRVDGVIENAVDTDLFRPAPGAPRNDRCLFVGSSDYYGKGFDILERIAESGTHVDCITATPPRNARLRWLGNVPNEELPAYYRRCRALLLPSRFEGSSLVLLEAMACGTPVVTTSVGSGPDIAREIPDFVVDLSSTDVAGEFERRLRTIDAEYDDFSARARDYIERHHSYATWRQRWLETLDLVLRRSEKPRS